MRCVTYTYVYYEEQNEKNDSRMLIKICCEYYVFFYTLKQLTPESV